ncbi:hypothetical protein DPMN_160646 [Dreissena polymorpha]|uniref:Uncharacterized protein n=1 Tax=Dreissena polymorpha TaxID=45954 RepID=A0A9D4ELX4_DREPO|nr:hypothetical protein DPMN_160646 [Dreissena polymorpha]
MYLKRPKIEINKIARSVQVRTTYPQKDCSPKIAPVSDIAFVVVGTSAYNLELFQVLLLHRIPH